MSTSISQQLSDLLNPLPNFADPEDDQDEETKARVIDRYEEDYNDDDDDKDLPSSGLRKRATSLLEDTDKRYRGKTTSRRELRKAVEDYSEEDDDGDEEEEIEGGELDLHFEDDEDEDEEKDNINRDDVSQMPCSVSKMETGDVTHSKIVDFHKLTEGMDDLGESEDQDEEEGETEDKGESEESSEEEDGNEDELDEDEDDLGAPMTFSKEKVDEEVEKGKAVKNQLALWDLLLEGRIKMQKALVTASQLPQPDTFPEFKNKGGLEYAGALKNSHKALKALQRSLLELQDLLLYQSPQTRAIALGKRGPGPRSEEEEDNSSDAAAENDDNSGEGVAAAQNGAPKRKLGTAAYPDFMAKRFAAFQPYCDGTLQKWHDKTRLTTGKAKGFGAFDRNILTQVQQVLVDKERLLRRTQTRRSDYRVLGKAESAPSTITEPEGEDLALKANAHLKDLDEEIFDDDDFYHQLLRELIERKTSAVDPNDQVAMGRQWLTIQKLRSKIKKKVDTKASKGRKVRFHIHSKLVNFMAPMDHSSMTDEARSELYRSLFGSRPMD